MIIFIIFINSLNSLKLKSATIRNSISLNLFFKQLKKAGLDGIEAFYPYKRHRAIIRFHRTKTVFELAKKYDFLMTAGTDKH